MASDDAYRPSRQPHGIRNLGNRLQRHLTNWIWYSYHHRITIQRNMPPSGWKYACLPPSRVWSRYSPVTLAVCTRRGPQSHMGSWDRLSDLMGRTTSPRSLCQRYDSWMGQARLWRWSIWSRPQERCRELPHKRRLHHWHWQPVPWYLRVRTTRSHIRFQCRSGLYSSCCWCPRKPTTLSSNHLHHSHFQPSSSTRGRYHSGWIDHWCPCCSHWSDSSKPGRQHQYSTPPPSTTSKLLRSTTNWC